MAARKSSDSAQPAPEPSFEDALGSLEAIVEAMEHEHLPLENLVEHYEKGSALLNRCEAILQAARDRIELITLRNQPEIVLDDDADRPLENPLAPLNVPPADDSDDDDDDIRLF